jgi:hypothetical protein
MQSLGVSDLQFLALILHDCNCQMVTTLGLFFRTNRSIDTDIHQQKTFPSGRNGCVRVDTLRQSRQRHLGGGLLRARCQCHASRCISPSDRRFFSLCRSPIVDKHSGVVANCDHTSEWVHWVHACIGIAMQCVTQRKSLLTFLPHKAWGA